MRLYYKSLIFFVLLIFNFVHANAETGVAAQTQALFEKYDVVKSQMNKHPTLNFDQELRFLGRDALLVEASKQYYKNDSPTDASLKRRTEILLDSYNDECNRNKSSTFCKGLTDNLAEYKKKYGTEYAPQAIKYPQIDLKNYTYTLPGGKVFELKQTSSRQTASTSATTTTSATASTSAAASVSTTAAAQDTSGVNCEWMPGSKRRLLSGEGCESSVCSAMVICTKNGKKIRRLATCSSDLCADGKATDCHKQLGFGSTRVAFGNENSSPQQKPSSQPKSNQQSTTR